MPISVSIYFATLSPTRGASGASGSRVTHLLGVNEIQEAQPANARPHADTILSGLGPVADDVSCDDSEEAGMQSPSQSAHSCHSGSQKSPRASDYPLRPEPPAEFRQFEPEEELRALMSFLWQWPLPESGKGLSRSHCCQTHQTLDRARDALRYLQKLDCQDVPACLGWQCPACKLKGTESDRRLFDEESWCCGLMLSAGWLQVSSRCLTEGESLRTLPCRLARRPLRQMANWYGSTEPVGKAEQSGWWRAFASGCSNFSIQYNYQCASIALAVMSTHNDLYVQDPLAADYPRPPWVSRSLLALVFVGSMVGMMCFGYLGDLLGHRRALQGTKGLVVLGALLCSMLPEDAGDEFWHRLAIARFLVGVGLGGAYPLSAACAGASGTSSEVGQAFFWQTPGGVAPYLVTLLLLHVLPGDTSWQFRLVLGLGALPAFLALAASWREESAPPVHAGGDLRQALQSHQRTLVGTAGTWFLFDVAAYGTVIFTPRILNHVFGESQSLTQMALHSVMMLSFAIPATFLAVAVLPRVGARTLNAVGLAMISVCFAVFAAVSAVFPDAHKVLFAVLCALYFGLNFGPSVATFVLPVELAPPELRSTFHGLSAAAGKSGALVGALLFPLLDETYGVPAVMLAQAFVCAFGALLSHVCLGESWSTQEAQ
ncbi:PHT1-3 [Symbiodinium sp. CCMP2456]|nr:PHT1-3 [Symbiodinium sp. CCMP2456]